MVSAMRPLGRGSAFRAAMLGASEFRHSGVADCLGAYGTGAKPILAIAPPFPGWTSVGGDVYSHRAATQKRMVIANKCLRGAVCVEF